MRASPELVSALRRAASRIEDPKGGYDWFNAAQCNCGMLARELGVKLTGLNGNWQQMAGQAMRCEVTGAPIPEVIRCLRECGIAPADIADIEAAGNATVCKRAGMPGRFSDALERWISYEMVHYRQVATVARYFRAQADILEEQLTPPPVREPVGCVAHMPIAGLCIYCGCAVESVPVSEPTI